MKKPPPQAPSQIEINLWGIVILLVVITMCAVVIIRVAKS